MNTYRQDDRAAVSVDAVCALAGVSKPSLYRDFGRQNGLTAAVVKRYGETVLAPVEALPSSPQSYDAQLDALISATSDDPQREASCLFVKMRASGPPFRSAAASATGRDGGAP